MSPQEPLSISTDASFAPSSPQPARTDVMAITRVRDFMRGRYHAPRSLLRDGLRDRARAAGQRIRERQLGQRVLELHAREHDLLLLVDDLDRRLLHAVGDLAHLRLQV